MNFYDFDYFLLLRLFASAIFGSLIGLERGRKNHEAGLRTHIVLCLGSASVMVISECLFKQYGSGDIMRMGAQVISGVGFLGAGSIIIDRNKVKGITTAAGLWTTACVGIAVGSGYYIIASVIVALMLFAMIGLRTFSAKLDSDSLKYSIKIAVDKGNVIKEVLETLINEGVEIISVKLEGREEDTLIILEIKLDKNNNLNSIISEFTTFEGLKEFVAM